ncbi:pyridoxamine 5'-phosphate oxidase, partial [Mycobacterium sp. ITM-2017-0098]
MGLGARGDDGDARPRITREIAAVFGEVGHAEHRGAAEEARTIAASTNTGTLATLTGDGDPWASFVTYGLLGGAPVL